MLFARNGSAKAGNTPPEVSGADAQLSDIEILHTPLQGRLNRQQKKRNKKIRHYTRMAASLLDKLVQGEPLISTGTKLEARLKITIDNMVSRGVVPEDRHAYYDDTLSGRSLGLMSRDISYNPLSEHLVHARHKIEAALGTQGSLAVHVMGAGFEPPSADSTVFQDAGLVIAVPGGLRTARQMMHYAAQRYQNPNLPPIIIENSRKFWDPLLNIAGVINEKGQGLTSDKAAAHELGIFITHSRVETISLARRLLAERAIKPEAYKRAETVLPEAEGADPARRI